MTVVIDDFAPYTGDMVLCYIHELDRVVKGKVKSTGLHLRDDGTSWSGIRLETDQAIWEVAYHNYITTMSDNEQVIPTSAERQASMLHLLIEDIRSKSTDAGILSALLVLDSGIDTLKLLAMSQK